MKFDSIWNTTELFKRKNQLTVFEITENTYFFYFSTQC